MRWSIVIPVYNEADFLSSKQEVETKIEPYHGIVIRSRFKIDKTFLDKFAYFELFGPNGHFLTKDMSLYVIFFDKIFFLLGLPKALFI